MKVLDPNTINTDDFMCETESGSWKCLVCHYETKRSSNLKRHLMLKHTCPTNDPCPRGCGRIFKHTYHLQRHLRECYVGLNVE